MKYLKLFESNTNLYVKMTEGELWQYLPNDRIDNFYEDDKDYKALYSLGFRYRKGNKNSLSLYIKRREKVISRYAIYKSDDEWYYVSKLSLSSLEYFKCDQLDGLLACLKNECVLS